MRQAEQDLQKILCFLQEEQFGEQERLPSERALAERLGLTRNRVRGVLRKLASQGLIWRRVGLGTFLGQEPLQPAARLSAFLVDQVNPLDVIEARLCFEPTLARLAAFGATGRDLEEMDRSLEKMKEAPNTNVWAIWDSRFHRAVAVAAHNPLMLAMFDVAQAHRNRAIYADLEHSYNAHGNRDEPTQEHADITRAIRARAAEKAERLMKQHLLESRRRIFGDEA